MAALVFLDTETLGLDVDDPIWEVAAIRREIDDTEHTYRYLLRGHDDQPLRCPDGFPEPFRSDFLTRYDPNDTWSRLEVAEALEEIFRDQPHIVGAVPNFDTERITWQLAVTGWHYHLIDVENLAAGWLAGQGRPFPTLPWGSDELSRAVGIHPGDFRRHTALDDARWARAIYDRITKEA